MYVEVELEDLSPHQKERLLSKVTDMVEVKQEYGSFLIMKYLVTQVLWESITGKNPSYFCLNPISFSPRLTNRLFIFSPS